MTSSPSGALLAYRIRDAHPEFLLGHPGGPYWQARDEGAWSIPKGRPEGEEALLAAALREFGEETGYAAEGTPLPLRACRLPGGRRIESWLIPGDFDPARSVSGLFEMEWPPGSGRIQRFPEFDRVAYFPLAQALEKVNRGQRPILLDAARLLAGPPPPSSTF